MQTIRESLRHRAGSSHFLRTFLHETGSSTMHVWTYLHLCCLQAAVPKSSGQTVSIILYPAAGSKGDTAQLQPSQCTTWQSEAELEHQFQPTVPGVLGPNAQSQHSLYLASMYCSYGSLSSSFRADSGSIHEHARPRRCEHWSQLPTKGRGQPALAMALILLVMSLLSRAALAQGNCKPYTLDPSVSTGCPTHLVFDPMVS
jgi:hypothetical protein